MIWLYNRLGQRIAIKLMCNMPKRRYSLYNKFSAYYHKDKDGRNELQTN